MSVWASDPLGRADLRYWDGVAWTNEVRYGSSEATIDEALIAALRQIPPPTVLERRDRVRAERFAVDARTEELIRARSVAARTNFVAVHDALLQGHTETAAVLAARLNRSGMPCLYGRRWSTDSVRRAYRELEAADLLSADLVAGGAPEDVSPLLVWSVLRALNVREPMSVGPEEVLEHLATRPTVAFVPAEGTRIQYDEPSVSDVTVLGAIEEMTALLAQVVVARDPELAALLCGLPRLDSVDAVVLWHSELLGSDHDDEERYDASSGEEFEAWVAIVEAVAALDWYFAVSDALGAAELARRWRHVVEKVGELEAHLAVRGMDGALVGDVFARYALDEDPIEEDLDPTS